MKEFNQGSLPNVIHFIVTVLVLFVTAINMDKKSFVRLNITGPFWLSALDKVGHFRPFLILLSLIEYIDMY